ALIGIFMTAIAYVILSSTRYGRRVVAVGSNLEAARRVGMPAKWILASVYLGAGVASAIAGLLIAARLGSGSSNAAVGFE
ncbi:ABC transporter permease subunit, partial [Bacillus subtilis]